MKTIIVGGGLGGLVGALKLANAGEKVSLIEKTDLGGRGRSPELGGRRVNLGAHALFRAGVAAAELKALGIQWKSIPPSSTGVFAVDGGELLPLATSAVGLTTSPLLDGGRFGFLRAMVELERAKSSDDALTLKQWVDRFGLPRRPRQLLLTLLRVASYLEAPDVVSAGPIVRNLRAAVNANVAYLEGGWQTLIDQLRERCGQAGVELRQARVERVHADGTVELAGGERLHGDAVITALPLEDTVNVTQSPELKAIAAGAVEARAACLDVVLDTLPRSTHRVALGLDRPTYFSVHFESEGSAQLHGLFYLAPGDDGATAREELEALFDQMQPGWRAHVKESRWLPHLSVMSRALKPGDAAGPVRLSERVWAAGDWSGPGILADGAVASVSLACRARLESAKLAA
ncbi:MAG: NAD(P)-binding protein [Myxococcaceae bacterium]